MNSFIVIAVLTVLNCINVANGDCTAATGTACKKTYDDTNTTTDGQKCTPAYTYGKCLLDAMCYADATQTSAFTTAVGGNLSCSGGCKVVEGLKCFTDFCSNKTSLNSCLDDKSCFEDVFKTAYDNYDATCISGGCGTVTVSVLMMFLSTLLMLIKNY